MINDQFSLRLIEVELILFLLFSFLRSASDLVLETVTPILEILNCCPATRTFFNSSNKSLGISWQLDSAVIFFNFNPRNMITINASLVGNGTHDIARFYRHVHDRLLCGTVPFRYQRHHGEESGQACHQFFVAGFFVTCGAITTVTRRSVPISGRAF